MSGKNLPEPLAELVQEFEGISPIRGMFQDETRFEWISDMRRRWYPNRFTLS
ncbi:hypothetical protein [Methylocaldum szegediense]|uniref:Uncharacterized protein n=1 Tax=Methylocaldum szegediense TaxID=73780 RepID=A0ABM9I4M7_9GAMM|nr:hypothetical protein [Methylocaldum szegediense]CAI8889953.1 protein of unknown function [Methylocaldum szegediense]